MEKQQLSPASGSRDFMPDDARFRDRVFATVKGVFAAHGFEPMETPAFERIETLSGKYGEEGDKLIFKILKRGDKEATGLADLALRYDLTVPAMRAYANNRNALPRIFKRYQIGPVWRADRPARGRFREFYQCDVDIIGSDARLADIEVLVTLADVLEALTLAGYRIRLNSRHVLKGMMTVYGVPDALSQNVTTVLDKFDKIGMDGVIAGLADLGLPEPAYDAMAADLAAPDFEERLRKRLADDDDGRLGLDEADEVVAHVATQLPNGTIEFDPILARGLDYYTGPIFEFTAPGGAGSIGGGGRYDNLAGMFLRDTVPVCGGSLGIERILMVLRDRETANPPARVDVYVTVWEPADAADALELARRLRAAGISAELDLAGGRIGKQMKAADNRRASVVLMRGPDEKAAGTVVLKHMTSGDQQTVAENDMVGVAQGLLDAQA